MNRIWQDEWLHYQRLVKKLTEQNNLSVLENYNRRGYEDYHLDHIVPIQQGFYMNINPHLMASLENLQFIPHTDNMRKRISLTEQSRVLLGKWGIDIRKRKSEWSKSWKDMIYAQNDTPKLLKEIERLERENEGLRKLVDLMKEGYYQNRVNMKKSW